MTIARGATYRLQLSSRFGFERARAVVKYLDTLGITDLYLSPVLEARAGSPHGYDVTDPTRLNPELGGETGFDAFSNELRDRGMGLLLDIVPNHMAADAGNRWWRDMLENGPASPFAHYFDIDWRGSGDPSRDRIVLPVLGTSCEEALKKGELTLERSESGPVVRYHEHEFPLDPATYTDEAPANSGANGDPGHLHDSSSPADLESLLSRQPYRLAFWKRASDEINYRRFFDISELAGVRVEEADVFQATHARILDLVASGRVAGLRIDHVDGLYDPREYLTRLLRAAYLEFTGTIAEFEEEVHACKRQVLRELFAGELRALSGMLTRLVDDGAPPHDELVRALAGVSVCLPVYRTYIDGSGTHERDRCYIEQALNEAMSRKDAASAGAYNVLPEILLPDSSGDDPRHHHREREELRVDFIMRWQQFTGPLMAKGLEDTALYRHYPLLSLNAVGSHPGSLDPSVETLHRFNAERHARWPGSLSATSTHDSKRGEDVRARIHVLSELAGEWRDRVARWHEWNEPHRSTVAGERVPDPNDEWLIYQTMAGAWPLDEREVADFGERQGRYVVKAAREAKRRTSWLEPDTAYEAALVAFVDGILEADRSADGFLPEFLRFQERVAFYGAFNSISQLLLKIASPGVPDFYQGSELWRCTLVDPDNRRPVDFPKRERLLDELRSSEPFGVSSDAASTLADLIFRWRDGRIKLYTTYRGISFRQSCEALFARGDYLPLRARGTVAGARGAVVGTRGAVVGAPGAVAGGRGVDARAARGPRAADAHVCAFARRWRGECVVAVAPRRLVGIAEAGEAPIGVEVWGGGELVLYADAPMHWTNVFTGESLEASPGSAADDKRSTLELGAVFDRFPVALLHTGAE